MTAPEIEVKFTQALTGVSEEHIAQAKRKVQEAFVMELLRLGEISAGRAARLLGVNRWELSEIMYNYGVSPFDETMTKEDLEREVADCLKMLEKKRP
jgi:predicted HTH domain antitoxin